MLTAMVTRTQTVAENSEDTTSRRPRDRDQTESRLTQAAIEMLRADGVLAGLNLRDVANQAGVSRASIYKFFGSRRQLLRRALSLRIGELDDYHGVSKLPFAKRKMRLIGDETNSLHGQLISLLVIDGDDEVAPMPFFEQAMDRMRDDVDAGHIHDDHTGDLEAVHIAFHTATRGYNLLRTAYARQAGVSPQELDARVRPVFETWLRAMGEPAIDDTKGTT